MATATIETFSNPHETEPGISRTEWDRFSEWFWRCQKPLHFTASLILGSSDKAASAVQNCWFRASRNPPHFEREGPFRSWVMRLLISEALSILHCDHSRAPEPNLPISSGSTVHTENRGTQR